MLLGQLRNGLTPFAILTSQDTSSQSWRPSAPTLQKPCPSGCASDRLRISSNNSDVCTKQDPSEKLKNHKKSHHVSLTVPVFNFLQPTVSTLSSLPKSGSGSGPPPRRVDDQRCRLRPQGLRQGLHVQLEASLRLVETQRHAAELRVQTPRLRATRARSDLT